MKNTGIWHKMRGKKKTLLVFASAAGIGLAALGIYTMSGMKAGKASANERPVQEAQAKKGTITNSIVGTGNLEYGEGQAVCIPSGITMEEVNVEDGDTVSKGDVLAVVNQNSVRSAIENVQEEIVQLDQEIEDSKEETDEQSVKSGVAGRIKKIYVQEDQEIADCMAEQGALMLLSLDGCLSIEVKTNVKASKGDSVVLTRTDGTELEGTVETVSEGMRTVLCTDSGVGIGEEVTVTDSNGNLWGKGCTSIHQQLAITAAAGTAEEICVSEDEEVTAGTTLLTIDNGGCSLEYQELIAQRQELTEKLQNLAALSQTGQILAEADGIITNVNITEENSQNAEKGEETVQIAKNAIAVVGAVQPSSAANAVSVSTQAAVKEKEVSPGNGIKDSDETMEDKEGSQEGGETGNEKNGQKADETGKNGQEEKEPGENSQGINSGAVGMAIGAGGQSGKTMAVSSASTQSENQDNDAENTEQDSNKVTAFTLASQDTMVLSVNVDELDINSVKEGQRAEITLDAMEGETFEGIVTKVAGTANSSNGGSAKYTVELSISSTQEMRAGMSASATITIEEREDIVTIPVAALWEQGSRVFVYTEKDSEGNLAGEKQITTGLSDGTMVEVTEGLSEGDTVYYQKTGNISSQGSGKMQGWPGGGEMPQGGFPGGESGNGMSREDFKGSRGEMPGGKMNGQE